MERLAKLKKELAEAECAQKKKEAYENAKQIEEEERQKESRDKS